MNVCIGLRGPEKCSVSRYLPHKMAQAADYTSLLHPYVVCTDQQEFTINLKPLLLFITLSVFCFFFISILCFPFCWGFFYFYSLLVIIRAWNCSWKKRRKFLRGSRGRPHPPPPPPPPHSPQKIFKVETKICAI